MEVRDHLPPPSSSWAKVALGHKGSFSFRPGSGVSRTTLQRPRCFQSQDAPHHDHPHYHRSRPPLPPLHSHSRLLTSVKVSIIIFCLRSFFDLIEESTSMARGMSSLAMLFWKRVLSKFFPSFYKPASKRRRSDMMSVKPKKR